MIVASQLREGMALRIERQIYKVLESEFKAGAGQAGGMVKTKLRNAVSGRMWEPHFRPDERLEDLDLERQVMEFLYRDAGNCVFMNPDNYEQEEIPSAIIGSSEQFLAEGMKVSVEFFEGRPISVVLPPSMEAKVAETASPMHSGQENTWKEARLENGVQIQVPLFIAPGETVRIDLKTGRYLERVRGERKKGT
jgi:elongation factor P